MKGNKESKDDAAPEDDQLLQAPLSLQIVGHPFKVLGSIAVVLLFSAYWTSALARMKDGMVFMPLDNGNMLKGFAASSDPTHEAMVFWCENCAISSHPDFIRYRQEVEKEMDSLKMQDQHCSDLEWSSVGKPMPGVPASAYISADNTTAFVEIHASRIRCMLDIRSKLKKFRRWTGDVLMSPGGPETVADASMAAEFRTTLKHSVFAVPICGLILWLVVGNVHMAVTPMLCVGCAYLTGKAVVGVCKRCWPSLNVNFDDSCVLFIVLALCVDYALFFWSRFNDERSLRPGAGGYRTALVAALHRSGTVILISNCFVALAYGCTSLLPYLNIWAYLGLYLQAMGGCVMAGVYSVTLTPALAAAFPRLFDHGTDPFARLQQALWTHLPTPQKIWACWARTITRGPLMLLIPLVAYGCMLPFVGLVVWRYKPSFDSELQGSRHDIIEQRALARFESHFSLGQLYPVTLVLEAQPRGPTRPAGPADLSSMLQTGWSASRADVGPLALLSDRSLADAGEFGGAASNVALSLEFGNATCQLAEQILRETRGKDCEVRPDEMLGLWWMPTLDGAGTLGQHSCTVSHPAARLVSVYRSVRDPLRHMPTEMKKNMPTMLQESLSKDGKRLLFKVMPSYRPTSREAYSLDQILREKILKEQRTFVSAGQRYNLSVQYTSSMQVQVDASIGLGEAVPKVLGIFAPLVAIAIGISFCSVFLAFKLALTVIVPIITTYGMAIAVYQLGWLDGLGVEMLRETGGLDFRMMVLTAGILFGFAMDYDLFLFVRVYERRMEGYDNLSAVKRALVETGPVITTAGTMMVVSFFFIMCSHTVFLRTMGFIFTVGVLFDVYVVRTMIAPVFLSIGENLNYWPRKMPPATKTWD